MMKVILKKNITSLGSEKQIVNVSDGYAINYLFPKKLAIQATKKNINKIETEKIKNNKENTKKIQKSIFLSNFINGKTILIEKKSGIKDKFFGAVTAKDIVFEIKKQLNVSLDKKQVKLEKNINKIGSYNIEIKIYSNIKSIINVIIKEK